MAAAAPILFLLRLAPSRPAPQRRIPTAGAGGACQRPPAIAAKVRRRAWPPAVAAARHGIVRPVPADGHAGVAASRAASSLRFVTTALHETLARRLFLAGGDGGGSAQRLIYGYLFTFSVV